MLNSGKRGQMYLIMAIVICLSVYSVIITTNSIAHKKTTSSFNELVQNVDLETSLAIDKDNQKTTNNDEAFLETVSDLVDYMQKSSPDTGALIMKGTADGETLVVNNLDTGIYVFTKGQKRYIIGTQENLEANIGIDVMAGLNQFSAPLLGSDKDIEDSIILYKSIGVSNIRFSWMYDKSGHSGFKEYQIKEIQESLEDVKRGRTKPIEQVAKELGIKLR